MFAYKEKTSASAMQTTWEKAIQNIGIALGQDISTELEKSMIMVILEPIHSQEILYRHSSKIKI